MEQSRSDLSGNYTDQASTYPSGGSGEAGASNVSSSHLQQTLGEYIKSGEYFKDARDWYNSKYLHIVTHRSVLFIAFSVILIAFAILVVHGYSLLPITKQVNYYINTKNTDQTAVNIVHANYIEDDPERSIADVMIRSYIKIRESYDYNNMKDQFTYVKNNSTRIVYRKFFSFMNTDNPASPILKFQRFTRRAINIISATYPAPGKAVVTFEATAKLTSGEVVENSTWQSALDFEMDDINLQVPAGSRFNFAVTNYNTNLIKDKLTK